jgi:hypothetical protein
MQESFKRKTTIICWLIILSFFFFFFALSLFICRLHLCPEIYIFITFYIFILTCKKNQQKNQFIYKIVIIIHLVFVYFSLANSMFFSLQLLVITVKFQF